MGKRQKDLDGAKLTGMVLALQVVKEHGVQALEKDIQARKRTGIQPPGYFFDLDECTGDIRKWCMRHLLIVFIAACRDEFGFGPGRMARLIKRVGLAFRLVKTGEASWWDYTSEIDKELGIQIRTDRDGHVDIEIDEPKGRRRKNGNKADQVHA